MNFSEIVSIIAEYAPGFFANWNNSYWAGRGRFVSKPIPEYQISDWKGACIMYKCPEFVNNLDTISVVNHTLIVPETTVIEPFGFDKWHDEYWGEVEGLHKKTRKTMTMTSWLSDLGLDGTDADRVARVLHARERKVAIKPHFYWGKDIVEQYREMDDWSHSCMTGHRANCTEIYAENPSQICLAVFTTEDGEKYGRALLFKPMPPTGWKVSSDHDEQPGPGWVFVRIYSSGKTMGSTSIQAHIDNMEQHLKNIGCEWWNDNDRNVVYTKKGPNELCPYMDGDIAVRHSGQKVVLYVCGNPHSGWEEADAHNCRNYGGGFRNDEACCDHCESSYDPEDEDAGHVDGWGNCCPDCYQEGVYCDDTDQVVPPDSAYPIRSRTRNLSGYATGGYRRWNSVTRGYFNMVLADDSSSNTLVVPQDEVIHHDGINYWWDEGEDMPQIVNKRLTVVMGEDHYPTFKLVDDEELTFNPNYIRTDDGEDIAITYDHRINNRRHDIKFRQDPNGDVYATCHGRRLHLVLFSRCPFTWYLVMDDWTIVGGNTWAANHSLLETYNLVTWVCDSHMQLSDNVRYIPCCSTSGIGRPASFDSQETPDRSRNRIHGIGFRPGLIHDLSRYDEWSWDEGVVRDASGEAHHVAGYAWCERRGQLMFIRNTVNQLVAVLDNYDRKLHKLVPMVWPSAAVIEEVGDKWNANRCNETNPVTTEMIVEWLKGGTNVVSQ